MSIPRSLACPALIAAMPLLSIASPPKIVTFGDSLTAPRANTIVYTDQLRTKLASQNIPVEFINKGIGGNDTSMAARRFVTDIMAENPQVVVILFGINDSTVDVWKTPPATASRVSLVDYEKNLRHFITEIQKSGGTVILATPSQMRWTEKLRELYGKPPYDPASETGFNTVLVDYVRVIRKLATEYHLPLVDIYAMYDDYEKNTRLPCSTLLPDGMHPNTEGQSLVANALEPLLIEALKKHSP